MEPQLLDEAPVLVAKPAAPASPATAAPDEQLRQLDPMFAVKLAASVTMTTSLAPDVAAPDDDPSKPVAVLISHGMGQQVPFATLERVADLLQVQPAAGPGAPSPTVQYVRFVKPDSGSETWLPRVELQMQETPGGPVRTVHLYETYWAPFTEGAISLTEVVRFLGASGGSAIWQWLRKPRLSPREWQARKRHPKMPFRAKRSEFVRWLFGEHRKFGIPGKTLLGLGGALLLVLSLVAINAVLTLVAGASLLDLGKAAKAPPARVNWLTVDLMLLWGLLLPTGVGLWVSQRVDRKRAKALCRAAAKGQEASVRAKGWTWLRTAVSYLLWGALVGAGLGLVVVAGLMMGHYADQFTGERMQEALRRPLSWLALEGRTMIIGVVWALTAAGSWFLRGFLVQYVGDVTIYLDAYKVDKFHRVRAEIKQQAYQTACVLYGARQPGRPQQFAYDRIVLAGHSLGSVVTYDALNATLHLDETQGHRLRVAARTGGLITFGSPLDKTAYIFHNQTGPTSVRSPLAASVQPLLRDPRVRSHIRWINLYSSQDPVSGKLDFYDLPARPTKPSKQQTVAGVCFARVDNRRDEDAWTPLLAHNQYWNNPALARAIRERIFAPKAVPA